ncbi:hypothetical protein [Nocardioides sp. AE5]|uniref:hypothetical protein n=1 Tax=Nocardioides sp. AE5 TaxID=2962573 RepID=UPI002881DD8E|nr:hypothetical protein [Nocardioides sp. AE5]MDT0201749.1 hypothetical protein [Nocardioides sp. AE5]
MIRGLGERGVTVLLSSHILAEVQQVCDAATIIGHGQMLASGPVDELIGTSTSYRISVADLEAAASVLDRAGFTAELLEGQVIVQTTKDPSALTRVLATSGIYLSELVPQRADLETVFLQLTEAAQ